MGEPELQRTTDLVEDVVTRQVLREALAKLDKESRAMLLLIVEGATQAIPVEGIDGVVDSLLVAAQAQGNLGNSLFASAGQQYLTAT